MLSYMMSLNLCRPMLIVVVDMIFDIKNVILIHPYISNHAYVEQDLRVGLEREARYVNTQRENHTADSERFYCSAF